MGIETKEDREARGVDPAREESAGKYLEWAIRNAHEISDEALLALFGREAVSIKAANAALLAGKSEVVSNSVSNSVSKEGSVSTSEAVSREEERRAYQRDLMRKRRAAEKQEAA